MSVFKYKVKIHAGKQRNREIQQNFKKYKYTSEFLCVDYRRDLPIYIHRQIDRHRHTDRQTDRQMNRQTVSDNWSLYFIAATKLTSKPSFSVKNSLNLLYWFTTSFLYQQVNLD